MVVTKMIKNKELLNLYKIKDRNKVILLSKQMVRSKQLNLFEIDYLQMRIIDKKCFNNLKLKKHHINL